jgi:hypothetical protein
MKNLKELKSFKMLSKKEQKAINGGILICGSGSNPCPSGYHCCGLICIQAPGTLCPAEP